MPMEIVAAPLMPAMAANKVQIATVPMASPPRSPPKNFCIVSYRSSAIRDFWSIAAMKMKSGIARYSKLDAVAKARIGTMFSAIGLQKK